jgi:hypothetical protein
LVQLLIKFSVSAAQSGNKKQVDEDVIAAVSTLAKHELL